MNLKNLIVLGFIFLSIACSENAEQSTEDVDVEQTAIKHDSHNYKPSDRWLAYTLPNQGLILIEQNEHNPSPLALVNKDGKWYESSYQKNTYKGFPAYKIDYDLNKSIFLAEREDVMYLSNENLDQDSAQACAPVKNEQVVKIKGKLIKHKNKLKLLDCETQRIYPLLENRNFIFLQEAYNKLEEQDKIHVLLEMEAYFNLGKIGILHMGALREEDC